jgi:alpha-L-fucosidase
MQEIVIIMNNKHFLTHEGRRSFLIFKRTWIIFLLWLTIPFHSIAQDAPKPYGPLPTPEQLHWQETELYCIIHFGPDTFTDKEWGYGDEDPAIFNPEQFDALQIVGSAKAGGFKGIIVVAKHHDGFCLWPSQTTNHTISQSPFQKGKGDILREYRNACDQLGIKMGVYCSPWDRNSSLYGKPEYVELYRRQLSELYSNYGPLFIVWHDGANGGDGYYGGAKEVRKIDRSTYYGWKDTWAIARKFQPGAVIFGDVGPDIRWVGNEEGHAGETYWATYTPHAPDHGKIPANGYVLDQEGTEGTHNGEFWMPAECDVSLRPGWFYHASQDEKVKSPDSLFTLYLKSVGRGACLDLGLSPDRRGKLNDHDVQSLRGFGDLLRKTFAVNLAKGASFKPSNVRANKHRKFGPMNLIDEDRYTYWATDDSVTHPELEITLPQNTRFNLIQLRENIKLGQRIEGLEMDAYIDGGWKTIARATSIGANKIIRLPSSLSTRKIRLRVTASPVCIALSHFGLFQEKGL